MGTAGKWGQIYFLSEAENESVHFLFSYIGSREKGTDLFIGAPIAPK